VSGNFSLSERLVLDAMNNTEVSGVLTECGNSDSQSGNSTHDKHTLRLILSCRGTPHHFDLCGDAVVINEDGSPA
jgi:hypothetical protein